MEKLTILVDLDDVMIDFLPLWVKKINETYGTEVAEEEILSWDMGLYFPGLTTKQLYSVIECTEFWESVKAKQGAAEVISRWMTMGHHVQIVTSSHYRGLEAKMEVVLGILFPFIPWNNVTVTNRKQMMQGDVMIDDGLHNLLGGDYTKILMTMPHNNLFDAKKYEIIRVNNWGEIDYLITVLASDDTNLEKKGVAMTIQTQHTEFLRVSPTSPIQQCEKKKEGKEVVTLYTTGCPKCSVLKQKLNVKNISFSENSSKEEMANLGIKQVPVLKVGQTLLHFAEANDWIKKQTV